MPAGASDTISIGFAGDANSLGNLGNDALGICPCNPGVLIGRFVYDTIYRFGPRSVPVPALAAGPCLPSDDRLTVTCRLQDATFSDGTPVTADDVVFTYALAASDACPFGNVFDGCGGDGVFDHAEAIDPRTVAFHLRRPDVRFEDTLATLFIEPKATLLAQLATLRESLATIGRAPIHDAATQLQAAVDEQLTLPAPACESLVSPGEVLLRQAGVAVADDHRADFQQPDGSPDSCGYGGFVANVLSLLDALPDTPDDMTAMGNVHWLLPQGRQPVGSGAWTLTDWVPGERIELTARTDARGGPPATPHIVFRLYPDYDAAVSALAAGDIDRLTFPLQPSPDELTALRRAASLPGVTRHTLPGGGLRDPRLQRPARSALRRRPPAAGLHDVRGRAGHRGRRDGGPGHPRLERHTARIVGLRQHHPAPAVDVAGARALIEQAGWVADAQGMYHKDGRALATTVIVNQYSRRAASTWSWWRCRWRPAASTSPCDRGTSMPSRHRC